MEFFKIRKDIPFMRHALVFNVISLVTFLLAVFFLPHKGLHFSVEFTGGTVIEVSYQHPADIDRIRATLDKAGYTDTQVQNFGSSRDVLIRMPLRDGQSSGDLSKKVMETLQADDKTARAAPRGVRRPAGGPRTRRERRARAADHLRSAS